MNDALKLRNEVVSEYKHTNPLPVAVVDVMRPIYESLSDEKLLSRCVDGYTQNACESFNSVLWSMCPKEKFVGVDILQLAVCSAVCVFNDGRVSVKDLLEAVGVTCGKNHLEYLSNRDHMRVTGSMRKAKVIEQKKRKVMRRGKKAIEEATIEAEGTQYNAGGY